MTRRRMGAPAPRPVSKAPQRRTNGALWTAVAAMTLVTALNPFITALILIGMAPTIIGWLTTNRAQRYLAPCICYLNLCGVLPMAWELWEANPAAATLGLFLSNAFVWLAMYGAAAVGWLVYILVPPLHQIVAESRLERRRHWLHVRQDRLLDEWGPGADPDYEEEPGR